MRRIEETESPVREDDSPHVAATTELPPPGAKSEQTLAETRMKEELDAVYRSTSWRVTAPLRIVKKISESLRGNKSLVAL